MRHPALLAAFAIIIQLAFSIPAHAELKIYYMRHAEGGHNVKKEWEEKAIPQSEWPSYVGNPNEFTPRGKKEVIAATKKLQDYKFDFIACSSIWRARNTILPYLRATQQSAEVWPELREGPGMVTILSEDIPDLEIEIINLGDPIDVPDDEKGNLVLREDSPNDYKSAPKGSDENLKVAYTKHASLHAIKLIEERFGGTDKSILLVGHNSSGVSLLKLLLGKEPAIKRGLNSTGMWMVAQQDDGTYHLKIYNDQEL
ncbi:histidine phosphatase family protein [Aporhodopirellula aestuarii]|uniref:Histidine phosphatase family protein n=1 Tax=Aporhodopirellula aestuarii TaxID=2950107 RepID=A0ABT0TYA4_9BACT|nr:histidine phosphatase family protein [Aporhodopirellula aestuarii]MCM2369587.1 histidine phosphatase family protein [Aporhodopirellula aestuarii]